MTRDDAIQKLMAETRNECTEGLMVDFIDMSVALGMLKLEEPKSAEHKFLEALAPHGIHFGTRAIFTILDMAGLKIVEK